MRRSIAVMFLSFAVLGTACAEEEPTVGATTPAPAETETAASPTPDPCAPENLTLVTPGRLTIGTDNPAFDPWFGGGTPEDSPWEVNDPSTGEGFESAVAYAVAEELGFARDDVTWIEVPFGQSFRPGDKPFDFDINQISYSPRRAEAVDFSDSYYDVNQALVAAKGTPIASATSLEELKDYKLAAPVATTSYDYIVNNIEPTQEPAVYDTLADTISALKAGQVDGIVADLPTAFFIVAVEVPNGVIVGQFPTIGEQEYFGMVFEKGNPLVACVNQAIAALEEDGTLAALQQEWLADRAQAPVLE